MTEQLLDGRQFGSGVEHIGGKRMAQHMGTHARGMHAALHCIVDHVVDHLTVKRTSVRPNEEISADVMTRYAGTQSPVTFNLFRELVSERDYSFFTTLSEHL